MPQILDRSEEFAKRKNRLAKQKRGPGVFVYDGNGAITECTPTVLLTGKNVPLFDGAGMPLMDQTGRQLFELAGKPVYDMQGKPVLGGKPKITKHKVAVWTIRGREFPAGKPVQVDDASLALKLRCMAHFTEVESEAIKIETEKPLDKMNKDELLELAASKDLATDGLSKAELIAAIKEAATAED